MSETRAGTAAGPARGTEEPPSLAGTGRPHVMFVHAHPDDESSKGAATVARYRREGYRVSVVTCTDGMRGDILNPAMDLPGVRERIGEIRRAELARALAILGVHDHFELGYADSGYADERPGGDGSLEPGCFAAVPLEEATGRLVAIVRAERPDVLVTYPPGGDYPHRDHVRCHDVSVAAFEAAADARRYPDAGPPWQVRKLYFVGAFSRPKVEALHVACRERGIASPFGEWIDGLAADGSGLVTTSVEVGDHLAARSEALLAHATQIDPHGPWFLPPDEVVREVYPYEDFVLARSLVPTELPEESLFAGIEPDVSGHEPEAAGLGPPTAGSEATAVSHRPAAKFEPLPGARGSVTAMRVRAIVAWHWKARHGGRAPVWFAPV